MSERSPSRKVAACQKRVLTTVSALGTAADQGPDGATASRKQTSTGLLLNAYYRPGAGVSSRLRSGPVYRTLYSSGDL
jgi:hypothetical protein